MKPGDLIEWMYVSTGKIVVEGEELWSTTMNRYVPIGSSMVHLLTSITNERITWLNGEGSFHTRVGDKLYSGGKHPLMQVIPRAVH